MINKMKRLNREAKTIEYMIQLYCQTHHRPELELCRQCEELQKYALNRLQRCPFHGDKPVCSKCLIHCYQSEMRERVRTVMRFAGPRMLKHHPYLAITHLIDRFRKVPPLKMKSEPLRMPNQIKTISKSEAA